ncbi:hypothetical protein PsYK624_056600 [Phanerochaete sordida]|uniref:Uncharacterized protein n=1 Tax=Phanerochaete sordida TaxID=48140 RepID=A0A9P3G5G3_9APHY|nr:hypothetical protein PsYK624_056600 [Phanerochaete sordida]
MSHDLSYIGDCVCIRQIGCNGLQAFVSKIESSEGNDGWFPIAAQFGTADAHWNRNKHEVAVIRNPSTGERRGRYVDPEGASVYITVRSLDDIDVVRVPKPTLPYIGDCICIRQEGCQGFQAFVSKIESSEGNDGWFPIATQFGGADAHWNRNKYEVAVIRNPSTGERRGRYVNPEGASVYLIVRSLDNIEVIRVAKH